MSDHTLREAALNPIKSFIVQAPAGSGKTELLTQRFLQLLNTVEKPEEIIAITFTRKAAAEMRHRIIRALSRANLLREDIQAHEKTTQNLALQALAQDRKHQWNLIENPNRLRVLTIDALCTSICAQTPILSQMGGSPKIAEDAAYYYRLATREFLRDAEHPMDVAEKIETLLLHLDNRVYQLETLFSQILAKREQWLKHILGFDSSASLKNHMENALKTISQEAIEQVEKLFPAELKKQALKLYKFAQENIGAETVSHPETTDLRHPERSRGISSNRLGAGDWRSLDCARDDVDKCTQDNVDLCSIANFLLTQAGTFRKTVTKANGFPAKHPMKTEMENLLESLSDQEALRHALHELLQCPPTQFSDNQWEIIEALLVLLPRLTAQLQVIFAEHSVVDFVEFNLRASFALGTEDNPTDLALYLDHQIKHLLIDEFQDTSMTQFNLIEKIIGGWQAGDGRSVFLVGDPMQSIYRFREANVGLFLRAKKEGIAQIPLHFIPLTSNFRSSENIVSWLNDHFPVLFPTFSDPLIGAIPYSSAKAAKQARDYSGVFFYPTDDEHKEAEQVAQLIQNLQSEHPTENIAILVRSRPQLLRILPLLSQKQIPYHAIEIESLKDRPEIQDLLTLTRALLHAADRIAWLALLRAPFCGLLLEDLQKIAQAASNKTIWEILQQHQNLPLSEDADKRVTRLVAVLSQSFQQKGRQAMARWIEGTWLALSGPAVLNGADQIQNAKAFFQAVSKLDRVHQRLSLKALSTTIATLSASAKTSGDCLVQVMTIHKSKGLEFDHVILPGCSKTSAHDQSQLLLWLERAHDKKGSDLLLAPIKSTEDDSDPIYAYLRKIEKNKAKNELTRLLYVGITRAKFSAHCIAYLNPDPKNPNEYLKPGRGSFLELLWNSFMATDPRHPEYRRGISSNRLGACDGRSLGYARDDVGLCRDTGENVPTDEQYHRAFERLQQLLPYEAAETSFSRLTNEDVLASFKTNNAAIMGTLIHLALEKLAAGKTMPEAFWKNQAMKHGLPLHQFPFALAQIQLAIENTQKHEKGRWILQHRPTAKSEMAITTCMDDALIPLIIDRTFCDENDVRWIIDFKTSTPKDISLEAFLAEEIKRYTPQVKQYAAAFAKMEERPIRMALYFPLIPHYLEIIGGPEHAL